MNRGGVIIPARWRSSRFPGKPLADIHGKPMIEWVYSKCCQAVGSDCVFVATDDERISHTVSNFGGKFIITSSDCLTGTDRTAEANRSLGFDYVVNVQGDEPMLNPGAIKQVFEIMADGCSDIVNCYTELENHEVNLSTVPKVVVSETGRLIYISRGGIPFDKEGVPQARYKQVCIYGFSGEHLKFFDEHPIKTSNERVEDIEILRFLEWDMPVRMVKVSNYGLAVDTPDDLQKVVALTAEQTSVLTAKEKI